MKQTNLQLARFEKGLNTVTKRFLRNILAAIMKDPDWLASNDMTRLRYAANALPSLIKALDDSGYSSLSNSLIKSNPRLIEDIKRIAKINGIAGEFMTISRDMVKALADTNLAAFEAIGSEAINTVHDILMESVLTGTSEREMIGLIQDAVDKDLKRYASTYAQTSRNLYMQQAEREIAGQYEEAGNTAYWEYVGPEDDRNRDECVWALDKRYFTTEEMEEFEGEGIRWNCRHIFVLITENAYSEGARTDSDLSDEELERRALIVEEMNA